MASALRAQWDALVSRAWPVWGAALLVATLNVFLFAFDRPWTASDGLRNWGDWVLTGVGLVRRPDLLAPWLYSGSLLNIGVIVGGTIAALLSREFAIRVPARAELAKGSAGGLLMGVGAVLAFGCNIGGFFSATSALSLSGLGMMLGLAAGAYLGLRYLLWEVAHRPGWSRGGGRTFLQSRAPVAGRQPAAGGLLPARGVAALGGGLAFGIGMTLAGGCGAGSLWRAGEGQVKLWVAVACFALGASLVRLAMTQSGLLRKLGAAVFLPASLGWAGAIVLIV